MYVLGPQAALNEADAEALQEVTAHDFVATAMASGDCDSVRSALRRKDLDDKVQLALRKLERTHRRVRGSESEKDALRPRFTAVRVRGGCSSLCFTLNPHDIRSPLTVALVNHAHFHMERLSLDWPDDVTDDALAR